MTQQYTERELKLLDELRYIESKLAPALGYEPYPPGSPGYSPEQTNYATGAHTAATLAGEAARRLRETCAAAPDDTPTAETTALLIDAISELIPTPEVSSYVADWPTDEQDYYRTGSWTSFTQRAEALAHLRQRKAAAAIVAALGTHLREPRPSTPADQTV